MLLAIGLVIGLLLGLTGAGGSVFAVPLLVMLGGLSLTEAVGVSLGAVAASTFYGSIRNWRTKNILWLPAIFLALTGAVFAPVGKWLGMHSNEQYLAIGFSILAAVIALRMWHSAQKNPAAARIVRGGKFIANEPTESLCSLSTSGQFELRFKCISGLMIGGIFVGLLSGLFGVGGGFLIVPLLMALSCVSMAQAVSTSLLIITLISGSGFIAHLSLSPAIDWINLAWVAAGGLIGMAMGQALSHKIAGEKLQKFFSVSLMCVAALFLVRQFIA